MEAVAQVLAVIIFVTMFVAVIADKWHRYIPAPGEGSREGDTL